MKRIFLVLSLAGNLVLAYTLARQDPASARIAPPPATLPGPSQSLSGTSAEQAAALNLTPVEAEALRRSFTGISHVDLRTYVQNLRAAGCPPDLLRLLVRAQAADPSAGTSGRLQRERLSKPYWKYSEFPKEALEAANAEFKAQRALLKELLGPEEMYEQSVENTLRQNRIELGGVPEDKRAHVRALLRDYDELTNEIIQQAIAPGGPGRVILLPEETERLAYLQEQKWKDLQALLTTSEFEDYAVRSSGTANFLRSQLSGFNPSEEEFRSLYRLLASSTTVFPPDPFGTPSNFAQLYGQLNQLQSQFMAQLSPERAADYKLATDPQTSSLARLVTQLELPLSAARTIATTQSTTQQRAAEIRRDSSLTPEARAAQLASLAADARGRISSILGGDSRVALYEQRGGGNWLNTLTRPSPTVRPALPR
ncbi:MAG TPA: hypothetical protein PKX00_04595 [Opitutaceae bacterium]|nr:hypothetical protein [Opitutaceae bacterium]